MCEGATIGNHIHAGRCTWDKAAGTWVKLVQRLPGMGSQVAQQVGIAAEAAATQYTGVRPCAGVNQQVAQQVAAAIEALATLRALLGDFHFLL